MKLPKLTTLQQEQLLDAQRRGFLLYRSEKSVVVGHYYEWCDSTNRPMMRTFMGSKWSNINLDLTTTFHHADGRVREGKLSEYGMKQFKRLLFDWNAKSESFVSDDYVYIAGIPVEKAEQYSQQLLDMLENKPKEEERKRGMVKIFKSSNDGEFVIQTTCDTPEKFVEEFLYAFVELVTQSEVKDDIDFICSSMPQNFLPLANKLGGYKAERVNEQRVLTCGFAQPGDEDTRLLILHGR